MASLAQRLRTVEAVLRPPLYPREAQLQTYVHALSDMELSGLHDALMRARHSRLDSHHSPTPKGAAMRAPVPPGFSPASSLQHSLPAVAPRHWCVRLSRTVLGRSLPAHLAGAGSDPAPYPSGRFLPPSSLSHPPTSPRKRFSSGVSWIKIRYEMSWGRHSA
jgi:hypothetical protein